MNWKRRKYEVKEECVEKKWKEDKIRVKVFKEGGGKRWWE